MSCIDYRRNENSQTSPPQIYVQSPAQMDSSSRGICMVFSQHSNEAHTSLFSMFTESCLRHQGRSTKPQNNSVKDILRLSLEHCHHTSSMKFIILAQHFGASNTPRSKGFQEQSHPQSTTEETLASSMFNPELTAAMSV